MHRFTNTTSDILPLADGVSKAYLLHHHVCPIAINEEGALVVATAPDALLPEALDDLGIVYRRPVVADGKPPRRSPPMSIT